MRRFVNSVVALVVMLLGVAVFAGAGHAGGDHYEPKAAHRKLSHVAKPGRGKADRAKSRSARPALAKTGRAPQSAPPPSGRSRTTVAPGIGPVTAPGTPPTPVVGDAGTTATPFDLVQLAALRPIFLRPSGPPPGSSRDNDEVVLGERLFFEPRLSSDHKMSCATCHEPERAFTDGRTRARGDKGQPLPRNTPPLWNLAWQKRFFWDGRAGSLETQVKEVVEREGEMDGTLDAVAYWLAQDASYASAFRRVYRTDVQRQPDIVAKAIAAYERTLVSPQTRFDSWVDGDDRALAPEELAGLRIFSGKGRCLACHGGWRFTDDDVHDIGLASLDRGATALPGATSAGRAFKTPSLREIDWTGPYMHDGSLMTLDDVLDHYTRKIDRRASLAAELRNPLTLAQAERADLLAFLRTLSSERLPRPR